MLDSKILLSTAQVARYATDPVGLESRVQSTEALSEP